MKNLILLGAMLMAFLYGTLNTASANGSSSGSGINGAPRTHQAGGPSQTTQPGVQPRCGCTRRNKTPKPERNCFEKKRSPKNNRPGKRKKSRKPSKARKSRGKKDKQSYDDSVKKSRRAREELRLVEDSVKISASESEPPHDDSNFQSKEFRVEPGWNEKEFKTLHLGDHRLDCRLIKLSKSLSGQPQAPINKACEDWKNTKAAYDFFDNEKASPERILKPHQRSTVERMKEYPRVLKIQDTTYYNFTSHRETRGLGPIGTEDQNLRGLVGHCTLVVIPEGLPLGVLAHKIWARDDEDQGCAKKRAKLPIEEKESYKWLESIQETRDLMPEGVEVVNVNDRESDIYEFFQEVGKTGEKLLVRSLQNRCLLEDQKKLWDFISSQPVEGLLEVSVPPKDKQPARTATVEIRFGSVTLKPPQRLKSQKTEELKPMEVDGVRVKEINTPEGVDPLDWKLLTTVPVKTFDDAVERVSWYRARWNIETYFKVLKSGCKVEDCRLETAERLIRFITLKSVIAWRLFWMTKINRINPDAACTLVLTDHEWRALYTIIHGKGKLPARLPTVRQVVHWIARLGGFLGRKCDKEPGITVMWRGWHRLNDFAAMYLVLL